MQSTQGICSERLEQIEQRPTSLGRSTEVDRPLEGHIVNDEYLGAHSFVVPLVTQKRRYRRWSYSGGGSN
jgi:hypothetical protein